MGFLFVDRITELVPGEISKGIKHVSHEDKYLYPNNTNPHFISSFIGEALGQLTAWNVMWFHSFALRPVAGVVANATLSRPAYVGETIYLTSFISHLDELSVEYQGVAEVNGEVAFEIEGALGPLLPMAEFIDAEEARLQFAQLHRSEEVHLSPSQHFLVTAEVGKTFFPFNFSFDYTVDFIPKVSLTAEKRITPEAPYFSDHFPRKPVLPMTVLLECILNLALEFIERSGFESQYKIRQLRKIKMNEFIQPGDSIVCHLHSKSHTNQELILHCRTELNGKRVCLLDIVMRAEDL